MDDAGPLAVIFGLILFVLVAVVFSQTGADSLDTSAVTTMSVIKLDVNGDQTSVRLTGAINGPATDNTIWAAYQTPSGDYILAKALPHDNNLEGITFGFDVPQPRSQDGSKIVFLSADNDVSLHWGGSIRGQDGTLPIGKTLPKGARETFATTPQPLLIQHTSAGAR